MIEGDWRLLTYNASWVTARLRERHDYFTRLRTTEG
jgi:hypothetical protein